jgi:hypothetical protein
MRPAFVLLSAFLIACSGAVSIEPDTGPGAVVDGGSRRDGGSERPDAAAAILPVGPRGPLTEPSVVTTAGRQLLVNGQPYEIQGVCWSPIPRGRRVPVDWTNPLALSDIPLMVEAGINTVRTYTHIDSVDVLDALAAAGIRVIQGVYIDPDQDPLAVVRAQRDHPAILMWELGNEWNYNGLYRDLAAEEIEETLETLASDIHDLDPNHPVATNHGELPSAARLAAMPSIDVWGLNVYRGSSFFGLFRDWEALDDRPMYIGEFGADAYDTRIEAPNLVAQEDVTTSLTRELVARSVLRQPDGVVLGGTIFAWADEWWKDESGDPFVHDTGGLAPGQGPPPDRVFNEEWWGLNDVDRNPRPALGAYTAAWGP